MPRENSQSTPWVNFSDDNEFGSPWMLKLHLGNTQDVECAIVENRLNAVGAHVRQDEADERITELEKQAKHGLVIAGVLLVLVLVALAL